MNKELKIALIGAGSPLFTQGLLKSLVLKNNLHGAKIFLFDINRERLDFMFEYSKKLMDGNNHAFEMYTATGHEEALKDADFVIVTVAVGGYEMRCHDIEVPLKYGIVHIKGDTTGPAGIFRGLRSIPFIVGLGKEMEKLCPEAVLINLSNPLTVICRAVTRETSIKTIGICSTIDEIKHEIAKKMGVDYRRMDIYSIGINHFTWMLDIYLDGRDIMDEFAEKALPVFYKGLPVTRDLYETYGCFPIPGNRYGSEFFSYYLRPETNMGRDYGFLPDDAGKRIKVADDIYGSIKKEIEDGTLPVKEGGNTDTNIVAGLIDSIISNKSGIYNLNIPNHGQLYALPFGTVIESPVFAAGDRIWPLCNRPLPERIIKLLERVAYEQELVVEAGVKGDRGLVMEAFLMDPLVNSPSNARKIIDELMEKEKDYLPQFF